ncbi:MAG TPA: hypothetical protein VKG63_05025 [Steroidobacteraceae bacterium]|nr:hypothetical protein [Steroidobacteraceae bacterium]
MSTVRRSTFFLSAAFGIIWAAPAHPKSFTVDDSGSVAIEPAVLMRWKTAVPTRTAAGKLMLGTTTIRVRINVIPWLKHSGRIYLALPAQQPGPISLSWTTQGRFLPGQLVSGNRVLVYAGPITTPFMEDTLTFQFSVDGTLMKRAVPVTYHFEIDEE